MPTLSQAQIRQQAVNIVQQNPQGIRFAQLLNQIAQSSPQTSKNTVSGSIYNLQDIFPNDVSKLTRGLFTPVTQNGISPTVPPTPIQASPRICERDFYQPVADWIRGELSEANDAAPLGGAFGARWGTPDVIGVKRKLTADLVDFPKEIICAEVKIDPATPVVAFGQAVAYRLFSSKVYIAMPRTMQPADNDRLEALCLLFGIGLIVFDLDPNQPNFETRLRAQRVSPDMYYVNEFARRFHNSNATLFNRLFG